MPGKVPEIKRFIFTQVTITLDDNAVLEHIILMLFSSHYVSHLPQRTNNLNACLYEKSFSP